MSIHLTLEARRDFSGRCTRCSQCKFVPAIGSHRYASACPSIDHGEHHAFSASGQVIMARGLLDGALQPNAAMIEAISSCTLCGACDVSCKVNFGETVEPLDTLYALRAKLVQLGAAPATYGVAVDNLKRTGNAGGQPRPSRAEWAAGLSLPATAEGEDGVLLHVGSFLSYSLARREELRAVVGVLAAAGVRLCYSGTQEGPTGATAFDLGHQETARRFAQDTVTGAAASGAKTLVTFSASAIAAFRGIYPRWGISFGAMRVLHVTEYVEELAQAGRLIVNPAAGLAHQPITYHDPCRLGRLSEPWTIKDQDLDTRMSGILVSRQPEALRFGNGGCYAAPRALLKRMGLTLVEMERHGPASYCCGAAGGVPQAQPDAARLAARTRLEEARDSGAATVVSGCSGCSAHLSDAPAGSLPVLDLIGLLAGTIRPA